MSVEWQHLLVLLILEPNSSLPSNYQIRIISAGLQYAAFIHCLTKDIISNLATSLRTIASMTFCFCLNVV